MPVYRDKSNGTWYCKFYYQDWCGERRQKWKRGFESKRDAMEYERDFLQNREMGPDILLEVLYKEYLEEMSTRLKPSTVSNKRNICETKIMPVFGKRAINDITAADIRKWQNMLMESDENYSGTYLKSMNNQMSAIFNYARRYYNLKVNPCEQAGSIGASRAEEMQYWTLDEFLRFREGLRGRMAAYACFEVLYWTGMREGELLALARDDVDLFVREIHITKTYLRLNGEDVITEPKTRRSKRRVLIPEFLCDELKQYMEWGGKKLKERLFPYSRNFLDVEMRRCCKKTGVKKIRIHDVRHSHVSLLINQGFDALVIADRVGHENVSTTLNTYSHLFPNRQQKLVNALEDLSLS